MVLWSIGLLWYTNGLLWTSLVTVIHYFGLLWNGFCGQQLALAWFGSFLYTNGLLWTSLVRGFVVSDCYTPMIYCGPVWLVWSGFVVSNWPTLVHTNGLLWTSLVSVERFCGGVVLWSAIGLLWFSFVHQWSLVDQFGTESYRNSHDDGVTALDS